MRIGEWLRRISSEGIEGYFAHKYDEAARRPARMAYYRMIAAEVARQVQQGRILEIGPGPGYVAIEIARLLPQVEVVGLDISRTMVEIATHNAEEAGVANKVTFRLGDAAQMPFPAQSFDFVVSTGSLHHWRGPVRVFDEIYRVLKSGGEAFIGDLRRDAPKELRNEMAKEAGSWLTRWGIKHSFNEAYTRDELLSLLARTKFPNYQVVEEGAMLVINLRRPPEEGR